MIREHSINYNELDTAKNDGIVNCKNSYKRRQVGGILEPIGIAIMLGSGPSIRI